MSLDKLLDKLEKVVAPDPIRDAIAKGAGIYDMLRAMASGPAPDPSLPPRELTEAEKDNPLFQALKRMAETDVVALTDGHVTVAAVTKTESVVAVMPVEKKPLTEPLPAETTPAAEIAPEPIPQAKPKTREPAVNEAALEAMWRRPRSGSPFSEIAPSRTIVISLDQYRK